MKQSLKTKLPQINDIVPLEEFVKNCSNSERFIAYLGEEERKHLIQLASPSTDYCILIGPEGDFSNSEIKKSQEYEFKAVTLGDNRLRTETAGVAACHILNLVNQQ